MCVGVYIAVCISWYMSYLPFVFVMLGFMFGQVFYVELKDVLSTFCALCASFFFPSLTSFTVATHPQQLLLLLLLLLSKHLKFCWAKEASRCRTFNLPRSSRLCYCCSWLLFCLCFMVISNVLRCLCFSPTVCVCVCASVST